MKNKLNTSVLLIALLVLAVLSLHRPAQAQQQSYTWYGYASGLLDYDGYEVVAVVSNIVRFNSTWPLEVNSIQSVSIEVGLAFYPFFDTYYAGYLDMSRQSDGVNGHAYHTEQEAVESRRRALDLYSDDNILLIHNFTMNDRGGGYVRQYDWSRGYEPERRDEVRERDRNDRDDRDRPEVRVLTSVNRFTGEVVRTTNWAEKLEWDAKFAEDNAMADRIQARQQSYLQSSSRFRGAEGRTAAGAAVTASAATTKMYTTTHSLRKAADQLSSTIGSMIAESHDRKQRAEAEEINKKSENKIQQTDNKLKALSDRVDAGDNEAIKQMAQHYANGYSETFSFATYDGYSTDMEYEKIDFIKKDPEIAYDLYQWAYSQQPTSANALEIGQFCYSEKRTSSNNRNPEAEAKWGKEAEGWFETAFFLAANKYDACMQIIAVFPYPNWCERAYGLSKDKVAACLAIGEKNANAFITSVKDKYSKTWDERAYTQAASQAEKDRVCEAIATRYGKKAWSAEAEKWYARMSSKGNSEALLLFTKANAAMKNYRFTGEGLKWYGQGLEKLMENDLYLQVNIAFRHAEPDAALNSLAERLSAKDPTGHIAAGMAVKHYDMSVIRSIDWSGKDDDSKKVTNTAPWVKQGVAKGNPFCQFLMAYTAVKYRLGRIENHHTKYKAIVRQKPEEAFRMLQSVVEKKDSAPKYWLRIEDWDKKRLPDRSKSDDILVRYGNKDYSIYTCAMLIIADMYEQGVGVEKNAAEAARWRKLAIVEYQAENAAIAAFKKTTSELTMGLEK